jgi:hypothetical protein
LWRLLHHINSRITFFAILPFTPGTPRSTIDKLKREMKKKLVFLNLFGLLQEALAIFIKSEPKMGNNCELTVESSKKQS